MVTKTQDWAEPTVSSATPAGSVTIGGGSDRCLIFVQGFERSLTSSATTSVAIGNKAASQFGTIEWESGGANDLKINYWYFDETALQAMSGNTISYSQGKSLQKNAWTYSTFSSTDGITVNSAVNASVSADGLLVPTVGTSADYVVVVGERDTENRPFKGFGNLSTKFDVDGNLHRFGLGEGGWQENNELVTGDSFPDVMLCLSLVIKGLESGGSGDATAPKATVTGGLTTPTNSLKPAAQIAAGVAERKIVWQGGINLVAPKATISTTASQAGGSGELQPEFALVGGEGSRHSVGTGTPSAPSATLSSTVSRAITAVGSCDGYVPTVLGEPSFQQVWYVFKRVRFG